MQLVAHLNGERIDATQMAHQPWRALTKNPAYKSLMLIECGLPASRVTLGSLQFFRHQRDVDCSLEHKSESVQHLAMKRALKERIDAVPGWCAEVEHAHPDRAWIADVMAVHTSGKRLAFEVQLSQQSEEEYIRRSQRYADDRVGVVWIVPNNIAWFRVQVPMIVTGYGKASDPAPLPESLMRLTSYQPMLGTRVPVGVAVDAVLRPAFRWPHGTPRHQLEEIARMDQLEEKVDAEQQARAAQLAEEKRLAQEVAVLEAAEMDARFIESATAPSVSGIRPVLAGRHIWASAVRCMESGHPMLIWRLTEPPRPGTDVKAPWMPRSENFANVRASVDTWLDTAAIALVKAGIYRLKGFGDRRAFTCPECKEVIKSRWVSALPPARWALIAEPSVASAEAREVLYRKPAAKPVPAEERPRPVLPPQVSEADWRFLGPRRKPYWMTETETVDAREVAQRLAAKEAYAARMQQLRDNPRYAVSPNGFRFECTDCGGIFEDDREGRHAGGACLRSKSGGVDWRQPRTAP